MTTATDKLRDGVARFNKNPSSIQQVALDVLEEANEGIDIVDPSNPFVFLLEASATMASAAINEGQSQVRKLYPFLATSEQDLYRHMSDKDYIGRWSTPSKTEVKLLLPYNDLIRSAVDNGSGSGVRNVTIPRNTLFSVNGVSMGIHYPIEIDILPESESIQVTYNGVDVSPLQVLTSNILSNRIIRFRSNLYLEIEIPVEQFTVVSSRFPIDGTASFKQAIPFTDGFYYARAYVDRGNNEWEPIKTTHSLLVYDNTEPTLVLEVVGNTLFTKLPDVYQTYASSGVALRLDIYTTRGALDIDLAEVPSVNYSAKWTELDTYADTTFNAPLSEINDMIIYSEKTLSGGADGRTLEETRERVIYGVGSRLAPITPGDIDIGLKTYGYLVQKYIDNLSDRVYVASKGMPLRERNGLSTSVLATNAFVSFNENTPGYTRALTKNISRSTVKPDALYEFIAGGVRILSDAELDNLDLLLTSNPEQLTATLNAGDFFYSPFYYVLDYSIAAFKVRPYYLDAPSITGRSFINENKGLAYSIVITDIALELVDTNFVLKVTVSKPATVTDLHCQLHRSQAITNKISYMNHDSTVVLAESMEFTFNLETNFDVNQAHQLEFVNLLNASGVAENLFLDLETTFNLFFLVDGVPVAPAPPTIPGTITDFDGSFVNDFTSSVIAVSHETATIRFGDYMDSLWTPARNIVGPTTYQRYTADVPAVYEETEYQINPDGTKVYTINGNSEVIFVEIHSAGDPVLAPGGAPVMAHYNGDIIYDQAGDPLPLTDPDVERLVGLTLVDAIYRYATEESTVDYRDDLPRVILSYLENEITPASKLLTERTELYYKPKGAVGDVRISLGGGISRVISSELEFKVTYHLTNVGYANSDLRARLDTVTRNTISEAIKGDTISITELESALKIVGGGEVLNIDIEKFGPGNDIAIMTLEDGGDAFSIRENLVVLPNGIIDVQDSVEVNYVDKHA